LRLLVEGGEIQGLRRFSLYAYKRLGRIAKGEVGASQLRGKRGRDYLLVCDE